MHPDPSSDRLQMLWAATREIGAVCVRLAGYVAILSLVVAAAVLLWEQLPDALAQAKGIAVAAGWMIEPPPLRGSL